MFAKAAGRSAAWNNVCLNYGHLVHPHHAETVIAGPLHRPMAIIDLSVDELEVSRHTLWRAAGTIHLYTARLIGRNRPMRI
jgi:hypothetical protein